MGRASRRGSGKRKFTDVEQKMVTLIYPYTNFYLSVFNVQVLYSRKPFMGYSMDKLQLTGQNLGQVFNFRNGHVHVAHFLCYGVKLPNLKMKQSTMTFSREELLGFGLPANIRLGRKYARATGFNKMGWVRVL